MIGDDIVAEARRWIGTPWHHAARVRGVGVDCAGLLVGVLTELGIPSPDYAGYDVQADNYWTLTERVARLGAQMLPGEPPAAGDVLVFRNLRMWNHCGWATGNGTLIHAWQNVGHVVEMDLTDRWLSWLAGHYRMRGL